MSFDCYADDTQLHVKTKPPPSAALSTLCAGLEETKAWMTAHFLQLNSSRTEAILVGPPRPTRSPTVTSTTFCGPDIHPSSSGPHLGVRADPHLTSEAHNLPAAVLLVLEMKHKT